MKKIGQLLFIGIQGKELSDDEAKFIVDNNIGGIVLFGRNCESPKQLHALCTQIQSLRYKLPDKSPLFIAIDMEGGRVARLKPPFTQWPPMGQLGQINSTSAAFKCAFYMGSELRSVGINMNFSPSVDILTNPKNTVIGDRALGSTEDIVSKISSALVRGFIKSDIIPVAKHFPGHGNTMVDSHEDLPREGNTLEQLQQNELVPFKKAFRARLDVVMTAHILFEKIDPEWPVTLSEKFLQDILRKDLRYRNLVISDDLDMKALTKNYPREEIAVRALQAGVNILLYCNDPTSPPLALEAIRKAVEKGEISTASIDKSFESVMALKLESLKTPDPMDLTEVSRRVGHPDHMTLSRAIASGVVPKELIAT